MGTVQSTTQAQNVQTAKPTLDKGQAAQAPAAQQAPAPVIVPVSTGDKFTQQAPAAQAKPACAAPTAPAAQQAPAAQAPTKTQTQSQTAQQAPAAKAK